MLTFEPILRAPSNDGRLHQPLDAPLPEAMARGNDPLLVVGAIAGG